MIYSCVTLCYSYVEIEMPGKRKRRLPRHLTSDYLIQKRKRRRGSRSEEDAEYLPPSNTNASHRQHRTTVEKLNLPHKCDVTHCRARCVSG